MHNDKESPFTLTLLDGDLSLQVLQFSGREALNQPYRFDIEVIGLAPAMNLDRLLQQPVFLSLMEGQGLHGVLHSASREHRGPHRIGYKLVLVPYIQWLDRQRSRRVFHHLSVPMILRQLLEEHDVPEASYRFELSSGHYPVRPFCIQYEESDLALQQRLCEEEGIHYHFEHQREGHVLVLADDSLSFPQDPVLTPFQGNAPEDRDGPTISELFQRHDSPPIPSRLEARNRGSQKPDDGAANHALSKPLPVMVRPAPEHIHHDQLSRRQLERLRCQYLQIHGQSNQSALRSARIVQVSEHPLANFNDQWLLTETRHQGQQPSILATDKPVTVVHYRNQFTAIPWSTVFRPALKQTRPSIPGYQPARVLGPAGQPPALDDRGRIQVRLWPTAQADPLESVGIWLPVAFATPDGRIDATSLPKAGSDVLISFLDSDPDRPVLCIGMGHHPRTRPDPEPRRDSDLLLDWLVNRSDPSP
ncbi:MULTISPECIES: type VI secretion system Vgr family protein [unclassified Pseudomonas]|uniref:type VI secretion system Vgr family protein n=1 Tax=unclassified Pseudomonas TaxID=196821 RepID=UPI000C87A0B8|nr:MULTISPECIES: type VI secretion system tip protein TssI/VgrG [unclassified Pseudomonas]PMU08175.1 type VI secretion system tip protein VgrG [Pseudomonas sp. FW305-20]PMU14407.1 type VI secretion system tip protein VgrG [Pseudomonas sp. FW305-122]PMU35581.1 type VI secretion system tip protein VgrG [Pseudomonas sp. FW305-47B]PMX58860.1 type VI secretion system tip protein VgrG [Pseudomonas sp. FW305-60]PMX60490.1 type VI secretion system tip protein VgrG [Pseudomonas sp. FW305-33]